MGERNWYRLDALFAFFQTQIAKHLQNLVLSMAEHHPKISCKS